MPLATKVETERETAIWLRDTGDGTVAAVERHSGGGLREGPTRKLPEFTQPQLVRETAQSVSDQYASCQAATSDLGVVRRWASQRRHVHDSVRSTSASDVRTVSLKSESTVDAIPVF